MEQTVGVLVEYRVRVMTPADGGQWRLCLVYNGEVVAEERFGDNPSSTDRLYAWLQTYFGQTYEYPAMSRLAQNCEAILEGLTRRR